ncbi:MAG: hypothetical protein C4324_03845 [Blastocatellia bacterium]
MPLGCIITEKRIGQNVKCNVKMMSGQITIVNSGRAAQAVFDFLPARFFGNNFRRPVSILNDGNISRLLAVDFTPVIGRHSAK